MLTFQYLLPNERYIYKEFKEATVSQSYHIFLEGCEYSVPYKYLGFKVFVAYSNQSVTIYYKGLQIALHPRLHFSGQTSTLKNVWCRKLANIHLCIPWTPCSALLLSLGLYGRAGATAIL